MKVLFVASVYRHIKAFHLPYIEYFKEKNVDVYVAACKNESERNELETIGIKCLDVPIQRNPFHKKNLDAYKQLQKILYEYEFDLIHVHTPVAAFLSRLAHKRIQKGKLIYTAHGFHFYKGAPLKNWLTFYSAEKLTKRWTEYLITINNEDYTSALKMGYLSKKVSYVHGVGVEFDKMSLLLSEKNTLKVELGISSGDVVITYIAELNDNKNHMFLFENWKKIHEQCPNAKLLVVGKGSKENELKSFVKRNALKNIDFLGYRNDVPKILQISDIVSLLSLREGLPKSILEAMVYKVPCIVSDTRGLRDLVEHTQTGNVVRHGDNVGLVSAFIELISNRDLRLAMGEQALVNVKPFLLENVIKEYDAIYTKVLPKLDRKR